MKPPTITYLSNIYFEIDSVQLLPDILAQGHISHPLLVTDEGLVSLGMVDRLALRDFALFSGVETNPTEESVLAGLNTYQANNCDGVIALGGGSPMDCAKGISLLVTHAQPLGQYAFLNGGLAKIAAPKPPVIAIPTTAGTGSEVGRAALLTLSNGKKMALISPRLIPTAVISDPSLTLAMPARLTAASGMDAISHCVETYCSNKFNPVADAIALDGLARGYRNIRQATRNGSDIAARTEMLLCSLQGGLSLQKGLGLVHSLSHPLGSLRDKSLHHGTLNAIFLPHVMAFNMRYCPEKADALAKIMSLPNRNGLPDAFTDLIKELELPLRLSELAVTMHDIEPLVADAFRDHCTATNPRVATEQDCKFLFEEAL